MKKSTKSSLLNFWANLLLLVGFISLIIFGYLMFQRYNPQNLAFDVSDVNATQKKDASSLMPIGIKIDSLNLSLSIIPAEMKNNQWEATSKGVSYLSSSVIPGEKGNSILYGHNWPNLLGNLKKIKPGDKISIIYNDNSKSDFEVEIISRVSPSEGSILENSNDNRITLYTCDGFLDSQRLVVVAKLAT